MFYLYRPLLGLNPPAGVCRYWGLLWAAALVVLVLWGGRPVVAAPAAADSAARAVDTRAAVQAARHWRQQHEKQIVRQLIDLLALPNFGGHRADIRRNAEYIVALLQDHGIAARLLEAGDSNPAVYGELKVPGATQTITLYVHYDGQPTSDAQWTTPPFTPVLRAGRVEAGADILDWAAVVPPYDPEWRIYARSAGDDKAPIIALLAALQALREAGLQPAANLKFFFEGEEEIGSPNLREMVSTHRDLLDADLWLFLDGPVDQSGAQSLSFGVRGVTGLDITVYGPERGLHSGHYGNFAPNPIARLAHLLASMRDEQGTVLIAGFNDEVIPPSAAERALIDTVPDKNAWLINDLGLAAAESGAEAYIHTLLRPALNFKGINAGEVGAQSRNVIVPSATASVGIRLVPAQTIARVRETVEAHIRAQGYHLVRNEPSAQQRRQYPRLAKVVWEEAGYPAVRTALDTPAAQRLTAVVRAAAGGELILTPSLGGSLPLAHITQTLQVPIALLPIANHDDNQHAPDENLRLANLWRGIEMYAAVLAHLRWDTGGTR